MPRHPRADGPDTWHHVMNRAIARRALFEDVRDIRAFLARLARVVRAGQIELHAFCVLTTHFHLLVRSPEGRLSVAMQSVQNEYSRWFNRSRKRDGPLYRGRFRSRRVSSLVYRRQLVRYIDANPVQAGLAATAALYPHGSARCYAELSGPPWLAREWIEGCVRARSGQPAYEPRDYAAAFSSTMSPRLARLLEKRIDLARDGDDPLDDLLGAAPGRVQEWMRRKALLADGTSIGLPVCDEDDVDEVVAAARQEQGEWAIRGLRESTSAWPQVHVALLRDLSGASLAKAGVRSGRSINGASVLYARHQRCIAESAEYAERVAVIAARALESCHRVP